MRISRPRFAPSLPIVALLVAAAMLAAGGCADGFVPEARSINPYVRRQWEADEKKGPTYYTRVEVLRKVRTTAHRMPPEEHQRLAKEIADVLEIEKSGTMRAELVRTLAVLPCPTALIALEAASTDNDGDVRTAACQALASQEGPDAIKLLAQLTGDSELDVRMEAAKALGKHQGPEASQALALCLDEHDPAIQRIAMESLKSSTGKDYGMSAKSWREYLDGGDPRPPEPPSWAERLREYWY